MKNLKELVREQFHKLFDEHGTECAIETVKNDQSFLLSEYRPAAIADIIGLQNTINNAAKQRRHISKVKMKRLLKFALTWQSR